MATLKGENSGRARISCAQTHARKQQKHLPGRIGLPINFALQFEAVCVPVRWRLRLMLACMCVRARMHARVREKVRKQACLYSCYEAWTARKTTTPAQKCLRAAQPNRQHAFNTPGREVASPKAGRLSGIPSQHFVRHPPWQLPPARMGRIVKRKTYTSSSQGFEARTVAVAVRGPAATSRSISPRWRWRRRTGVVHLRYGGPCPRHPPRVQSVSSPIPCTARRRLQLSKFCKFDKRNVKTLFFSNLLAQRMQCGRATAGMKAVGALPRAPQDSFKV